MGETQAGKGSLRYDHPLNLGAIGVTGTLAANRIARDADLVIGIGTRYSDFTTASKTAFQNPDVRFVNINVAEFDAGKHGGLPLIGDARATLEELAGLLDGLRGRPRLPGRGAAAARRVGRRGGAHLRHPPRAAAQPGRGDRRGQRAVRPRRDHGQRGRQHARRPAQAVARRAHPKNYHLEYGYSCMGYEIAGGLGVKMAAPEREVYVIVGDGTYLMMSSEIVTSVQEGVKLIVLLWDNDGFKSIGSLSRSLGQDGFGTRFIHRQGRHPGRRLGRRRGRAAADRLRHERPQPGRNVIECVDPRRLRRPRWRPPKRPTARP